ncbi:amidohydrolase family protein [Streptomyces sp. NPDC021098]|uniref:amidohydrolase family protein n=1 Tax=unclassified Streptomyces TaxID=2593676 RepID=UPI0037A21062
MLDPRFFKSSDSGRPTEFGVIYPSDERWLATRTREEVCDPELEIVDPHHHLWEQPFPYQLTDLVSDLSGGHRVGATVFVECGAGYRTGGPEVMRPVGETEAVAQQAAVLDAAGSRTRIAAGIVGFADLTMGPGVQSLLEQHVAVAHGRFRGVRFSTGWDASDRIENAQAAKRPGMLAEPGFREGVRALARLGLSFDAWVFHTQLTEVADLADASPGLEIVLNHCGGSLGYGPYATDRRGHFARWESSLFELARRPNVSCKLGGLLARGAAFDYLTATVPPTSEQLALIGKPWLETCIEAFGPSRCMFESNYPVEKMGVDYTTLWNAFKKATAEASPHERALLFSGTARRVYRLPN